MNNIIIDDYLRHKAYQFIVSNFEFIVYIEELDSIVRVKGFTNSCIYKCIVIKVDNIANVYPIANCIFEGHGWDEKLEAQFALNEFLKKFYKELADYDDKEK